MDHGGALGQVCSKVPRLGGSQSPTKIASVDHSDSKILHGLDESLHHLPLLHLESVRVTSTNTDTRSSTARFHYDLAWAIPLSEEWIDALRMCNAMSEERVCLEEFVLARSMHLRFVHNRESLCSKLVRSF